MTCTYDPQTERYSECDGHHRCVCAHDQPWTFDPQILRRQHESWLDVREAERARRRLALEMSSGLNNPLSRIIFAERFWRWAATVEAAMLIGVVVYWVW